MSTTEQKALALRLADEQETLLLEVANGERKPGKLPLEPFVRGAAELRRLSAENEALRASLNKANAQTEEFERKWYLVTDERDALRAQVEALTENHGLTDGEVCDIQYAVTALEMISEKKAYTKDFDLDGCYKSATINDAAKLATAALKRLAPVYRKLLSSHVKPTPSPLTRPAVPDALGIAQRALKRIADDEDAPDIDSWAAHSLRAGDDDILREREKQLRHFGRIAYEALEQIEAGLAAAPQPPGDIVKLTVIDPTAWEPCSPGWLMRGGNCADAPRLWHPATCNHWHPKIAAAPQPEATGPSGDKLGDFNEGQWWLAELDAAVSNGTHDQKRAVAVVRNLLKTAHATVAASQPEAQPTPPGSSEGVIPPSQAHLAVGAGGTGGKAQPTEAANLPTIKGASLSGGYVIVTPAGWGDDKAPAVRDAILKLFPVDPKYYPKPTEAAQKGGV